MRRATAAVGTMGLWMIAACGGEPLDRGDDAEQGSDEGIVLDDGGADDGPMLDVGSSQQEPAGGCNPAGDKDFSYIWIANTEEGTVSKTVTKGGQGIDNSRLLLAA